MLLTEFQILITSIIQKISDPNSYNQILRLKTLKVFYFKNKMKRFVEIKIKKIALNHWSQGLGYMVQ